MTIYYSPSTNGLYPDGELYGKNLPQDVVTLSASDYQTLIEGQSAGKVITPNGSELPYLSEPDINYLELTKKKLAEYRTRADAEIAPLQDAVDLMQATETEKSALLAWKAYRLALYRTDISDPENVVWPAVPAGDA